MAGSGTILERLRHGPPLVLDGPTGTELERRGVDTTLPLWSARAIMDAPDVLKKIHRDHLLAGAEVHTANTFRTNPRTLERAGVKAEGRRFVESAVRIARQALEDPPRDAPRETWLAGSLAPVEDCYRPDLVPDSDALVGEHALHAEDLHDAGVDLLLVETMNSGREAEAATKAARETGLPVLVSFVASDDKTILSGEPLEEVIARVASLRPDGILLNCADVETTTRAVRVLRDHWEGPWGAYANTGKADPIKGWEAAEGADVATYQRHADEWLRLGARLVGGCCGTRPEHTAAIARHVRQVHPA
ncbi:MAG: homocysteine S-methyltransferase family protein [Euryarchaeota archaeon]|nr:homocysteine S-methyltransferase family protein [Euryarchaeota archaeon]